MNPAEIQNPEARNGLLLNEGGRIILCPTQYVVLPNDVNLSRIIIYVSSWWVGWYILTLLDLVSFLPMDWDGIQKSKAWSWWLEFVAHQRKRKCNPPSRPEFLSLFPALANGERSQTQLPKITLPFIRLQHPLSPLYHATTNHYPLPRAISILIVRYYLLPPTTIVSSFPFQQLNSTPPFTIYTLSIISISLYTDFSLHIQYTFGNVFVM